MKNYKWTSERLRRASDIITYDRLGVSSATNSLISGQIQELLNEYFALNSEVKIKIVATKSGFSITINATAKGVKEVKILP